MSDNSEVNFCYVAANNFIVNDKGVFKLEDDNKIPVCDPLYVLALARDDSGNEWGKLLSWKDKDGKEHRWTMPDTMLAGDGADYRKVLLSGGLGIRAGRKALNALHDYIMSQNPRARATCVSKPGWHGNQYVMPDGVVIGNRDEKILLQTSSILPKIEGRGDLDTWKRRIGKFAEGNSRIIFALSACLSGILLSYCNETSGGFHFSGGSSTGKTTVLKVASSVWGGALKSWRTTDNAAESYCRFANDGFLGLDELGQVDSKAAEQMSYMLGNGQGKGRSNRDGIAKEPVDFRVLFISTGEIGLADKLFEGNKRAKAGQVVRMIEIPADAGSGMGVFEDIHQFDTSNSFAVYLGSVVEQNKGYVAPNFIDWVSHQNRSDLEKFISKEISEWVNNNVPLQADGQVGRVARRFALVAVTGELAIKSGVYPWNAGAANEAAVVCFKAWLSSRGGIGSHEVLDGVKQVVQFIERHGNSRFQVIGDGHDNDTIHNRVGFKRQTDDGRWMYMITPETFRSEVLVGAKNSKQIIEACISEGLIIRDNQGNSTQSRDLPGLKKTRVLCLIPSLQKDKL